MNANNGSNQNRGNANSGNSSGANNQNSGGRKRKKSRKKPKLDPLKYWGDPTSLPIRNDYALETADPTAVIRSLGKAPIPGKTSAPELYFEVLYKRAAGLAQALAFAGSLNQGETAAKPSPGNTDSDNTDSDKS